MTGEVERHRRHHRRLRPPPGGDHRRAARPPAPAAEGKVIAVVQPHRYTRLASLFEDFCACFNDADLVIVAEVFAAGEAADRGHRCRGFLGRGPARPRPPRRRTAARRGRPLADLVLAAIAAAGRSRRLPRGRQHHGLGQSALPSRPGRTALRRARPKTCRSAGDDGRRPETPAPRPLIEPPAGPERPAHGRRAGLAKRHLVPRRRPGRAPVPAGRSRRPGRLPGQKPTRPCRSR